MRKMISALLMLLLVCLSASSALADGLRDKKLTDPEYLNKAMERAPKMYGFGPLWTPSPGFFQAVEEAPKAATKQLVQSLAKPVGNAVKTISGGWAANCVWDFGSCVKRVRSWFE